MLGLHREHKYLGGFDQGAKRSKKKKAKRECVCVKGFYTHQGPTARFHFMAGGAQWRPMAEKCGCWWGVGGKFVDDGNEFNSGSYIIKHV